MEHDFHRELKAAAEAYFHLNGWTTHREQSLPNGKIADILGTNQIGKILIAEVKTTVQHYLIHEAYLKYYRFCDVFYVVAPLHELEEISKPNSLVMWDRLVDRPGLIGVSHLETRVLRQSCPLTMSPHIRLDVTATLKKGQLGW